MKKQTGMTLIELITILMIIGILAITALPRFMGLSKEARVAALKGFAANLTTAANLVYYKALIQNATSSGFIQINIGEGQTIWINDNGYPSNYYGGGYGGSENILNALVNSSDFSTNLGTDWLYSSNIGSVDGITYFVQSSSENYKKLNAIPPYDYNSYQDLCYVSYENGTAEDFNAIAVKLHLGKDCQ